MSPRFLLAAIVACATLPLAAQDYPARSPVIVVPFAAGGPFDIAGRATADALSQQFGRQFVVENKPGAGGVTGARFVAAARPDGYTMLLGSPGPLVIAPNASPGSVDVDKQFEPVGIIAESPQVLVVGAKLGLKTIGDLVAAAKAKPGSLNYGSAGVGTTPHLSAELFRKLAGVNITHVPYRGTSAAVPDLVAGELQILFGDIATLRPFIESGAVTALAVTGKERSKLIPQVQTVVEAGHPDLMVRNFSAVLLPAGTDKGVIAVLSAALAKAKADKGFAGRLETMGMGVIVSSPDQARAYIRGEQEVWGPLVKSIGLKPPQ